MPGIGKAKESVTLPDNEDGTYYDRHQKYENNLRATRRSWTRRSMIDLSLLWRKRFLAFSHVLNGVVAAGILGYCIWRFVTVPEVASYDITKRSIIVTGVAIAVAVFGFLVAPRMNRCTFYLHGCMVIVTSIVVGYLVVVQYLTLMDAGTAVSSSWTTAPTSTKVLAQEHFGCCGLNALHDDPNAGCPVPLSKAWPPCLGPFADDLKRHLLILIVSHLVLIGMQMTCLVAAGVLARAMANQLASFLSMG
ncbi:Tetraspanin [Plasmodiophora brassicae]|uniref:Tetraspanin n=1 Tax=Plasmodiophora brassicae TaxID=37360 RepID=A0A0G4IHF3_PLABS|nr:hypothetical protein PBRA_000421 [Plasmodiophora brassicae]SPQ93102.1 unnamed protein product [Plasmodiophora brassicae]